MFNIYSLINMEFLRKNTFYKFTPKNIIQHMKNGINEF